MSARDMEDIIRENGLYLRSATSDDARLLFDWRNDPETRAQSFHTQEILYEDHVRWLEAALQDDDTAIFVLMRQDSSGTAIPAGQLRLTHRANEEGILISYSIDQNERGKGFGHALIAMVDDVAQTSFEAVPLLRAEVRKENAASRKIFTDNGFACTEGEDRMYFTKPLSPDGVAS